jgi:F-type H+-transporting ATPase subunit delta
MTQGASRGADVAVQDALSVVLAQPTTDVDVLSSELFAVSGIFGRELTLRRTLADPSRTADERAGMVDALLRGKVSDATREVVGAVVRQRWSVPSHLGNALDDLAVRATVHSAAVAGVLDRVEDELFRFRRILVGEPQLRTALSDHQLDPHRKITLVDELVGEKVAPQTRALLHQAVRDRRGRTVEHTLERFTALAAATRERLVAHVKSVVELDEAQRERLGRALTRLYGRDVAINVEIDPTVLGGLSVRIGDEVVDATVLARLDEARRRLVG